MTGTWSSRRLALAVGGLVALLALVVPLADALGGTGRSARGTVGGPAPDLAGQTLEGGRIDLDQTRGDLVVVNVWASWCAPCRAELPLLAALAREHRAEGLTVVGVDTNDRREPARRLLDQVGGTDPMRHVYDPSGRHAVAWGARGLPETFVVDRRGRIVARHPGEVTSAWLEENVVARLGG